MPDLRKIIEAKRQARAIRARWERHNAAALLTYPAVVGAAGEIEAQTAQTDQIPHHIAFQRSEDADSEDEGRFWGNVHALLCARRRRRIKGERLFEVIDCGCGKWQD